MRNCVPLGGRRIFSLLSNQPAARPLLTSRQKSILVATLALLLGAAVFVYTVQDNGHDVPDWTTPGLAEQVENVRAFAILRRAWLISANSAT